MKCKICGKEYENSPRFCEHCGSYFIDTDDNRPDLVWEGVYMKDGTVSHQKERISSARTKAGSSKSGIIAVIISAIGMLLVVMSAVSGSDGFFSAIPFYVIGFLTSMRSQGRLRYIALFLLAVGLIFFVMS